MNNLILIWCNDFTDRDFQRFSVEYLYSENINFKLILFSAKFDQEVSFTCDNNFQYMQINSFSSYNSLFYHLVKFSPSDCLLDPYLVVQDFTRHRQRSIVALYGSFSLGSIPQPGMSILDHFRYIPSRYRYYISLIKHPHTFVSQFLRKFFKFIKPFDYLLVSGTSSVSQYSRYLSRQTHILNSYSFDYESFLFEDSFLDGISEKTYALFLDEAVVDHPDYSILNIIPYASKQIYYHELNQFFALYESSFNIEVVISAHPKSSYFLSGNPFNGRKIFYGNTRRLVANSSCIFAHASTSLSFAVLSKKPILLLTSLHYAYPFRHQISYFASTLGTLSYNLHSYHLPTIKSISTNHAKSYINRYLKCSSLPNSSSLPSLWKPLIDYISSYSSA